MRECCAEKRIATRVRKDSKVNQIAFCIFINTIVDGPVPLERDEHANVVVYSSRQEAEQILVESVIERCQDYLQGHRGFEDATTIEEYVSEVRILCDHSVRTAEGRTFGRADCYH